MTESNAKKLGYTHLGKLYGFYCYIKYLDDDGIDVIGTNKFRSLMIDFFTWIEVNIYSPNGGFIIEEIKTLD